MQSKRKSRTARREKNLATITTADPPTSTVGALKLWEAAHYIGVSVPTMHRLRKRGLIRANRHTRHCLFPIEELQRFLREGME
jgi:excisionase family DNA binding protein